MARIPSKNIARALYVTLKDKSGDDLEKSLKKSVEFLARKNLLGKSREILGYLDQIVLEEKGLVRSKIISPAKLQEKTIHELKNVLLKRYKANDIIFDLDEDPALIDGVRIETMDEVIDLSVKNKLNKLQAHLSR